MERHHHHHTGEESHEHGRTDTAVGHAHTESGRICEHGLPATDTAEGHHHHIEVEQCPEHGRPTTTENMQG